MKVIWKVSLFTLAFFATSYSFGNNADATTPPENRDFNGNSSVQVEEKIIDFYYSTPSGNAVGDPIEFVSTVNSGVNPGNYRISWDFGDNKTSNEPNTSYMYREPGVYNVTLTLLNLNSGKKDTATQTIRIEPPSFLLTYKMGLFAVIVLFAFFSFKSWMSIRRNGVEEQA